MAFVVIVGVVGYVHRSVDDKSVPLLLSVLP